MGKILLSLIMRLLSICLTGILFFSSCLRNRACEGTLPDTEITNTVQTILDDMSEPNEGNPHGVPSSYDWYGGSTSRDLSALSAAELANYKALNEWGVVYEEESGNEALNTRVQIRDLELYYYSKSSLQWVQLNTVNRPVGSWYFEAFTSSANVPSDVIDEPDGGGGGISATAGGGHVFHFFPESRVSIDLADVQAIYATVQARLITSDSCWPSDFDKAKYIVSVGVDIYQDMSTAVDIAASAGKGRFKYVTQEWQSFNFMNMPSEAFVTGNPPPLN